MLLLTLPLIMLPQCTLGRNLLLWLSFMSPGDILPMALRLKNPDGEQLHINLRPPLHCSKASKRIQHYAD
jgi:hypothetical protein